MTDMDYQSLCSIIGPVSRETYSALKAYQHLFISWNKRINLSPSATLSSFWERHILDSAQIFGLNHAPTSEWIDLGSGGGLPGMVLAILSRESKSRVTLVESNKKKTGFLHAANAATAAGAIIRSERIEDFVIHVKQPDVITARALASLDNLLTMAFPLFSDHNRAFFPKGRGYRKEIEESRRNWSFDLIEHQSTIEEDSVILEISRPKRR